MPKINIVTWIGQWFPWLLWICGVWWFFSLSARINEPRNERPDVYIRATTLRQRQALRLRRMLGFVLVGWLVLNFFWWFC